jgi:hypothetical protein
MDSAWRSHTSGQTHPVTVDVSRQEERYRGSVRLRQSEFGITPVTVAGGTIKVKDEIRGGIRNCGKVAKLALPFTARLNLHLQLVRNSVHAE